MEQFASGADVAGRPTDRHLGLRYLDWCHYEEKHLTPQQKARTEDAFAALPAVREPWAGWGLLMSELCRRAARQYCGLAFGEWPHAMPKPTDSATSHQPTHVESR